MNNNKPKRPSTITKPNQNPGETHGMPRTPRTKPIKPKK